MTDPVPTAVPRRHDRFAPPTWHEAAVPVARHWLRRAGGDEIFEECARLGGCPTGDAKATGAGRLPARHVVHAVGPVWSGGGAGEAELLASAHRRALEVAEELGIRTIAFPALSTGVYGYPPDRAAPVALEVARAFEDRFDEIRFVFLDDDVRALYASA